VTDCLDIVAIYVEYKSGVVGDVVMRPQAGWPIVPVACSDRGLMEGIDGGVGFPPQRRSTSRRPERESRS
jgi:hypothetical protein